MTLSANWSYPTAIRFGAGRIAELAGACRRAGILRPLFVTDRGLAALAMTGEAIALLEAEGLAPGVFSEVQSNPTDRNLAAGLAAYRAGGHDGVVAFGGGSALDLGKLVAFMPGQTRPVWDFEDVDDWWRRADADAIAPVVAVPTTAGTGSEVGRASVLTNTESHVKKVIFHPEMLPKVVIADPVLTAAMPRPITVGTGMDALAHALEAYSSPFFHPMSEGIALEGMRLVKENLPRVAEAPDDIEARGKMLAAAMMGAVAFQKGLGAIHAISHPIGALYDTHHGMTNAVVMPYVLAANRPAIEEKMTRLAAFLGLAGGFDGVLGWILELRDRLGVPATLAAFGVDDARFAEMAEMAVADPTAGGNPVPVTAASAAALLRAAHDGTL
ncbi:iron-containing alcohol dehydrogenase [Acuticoccus mangrovi]|uniref:Alcohol dehydrogenase 2 n=1 Tax=Acuticoccus mangrovi TaxID=2796142 RepID=A0A934ITR5_9HYPH|nr:iron-containing alcohol dehydrogenase [Acuticoccus mangrovi]MBJ3778448.1 iron-containing alcohol dehydrogenase [Acuticoccus mangrovi]